MTLNRKQEIASIQHHTSRIGRLIRLTRKQLGLTQAELAEQMNITIPTLRKLEAGNGSVSLHTFLGALSILNLEDDILHDPVERRYRHLPIIRPDQKASFSNRLQTNGINARDAENSAWILSLSARQRIRLLQKQEKEQQLCGIALR